MAVDVIRPFEDPRISHEYAQLNGRKYHYLLGMPKGEFKDTIFLLHGWPDISFGWRYQIPMFLEMGLRVVCPELMGFGRTEAPSAPPESLSVYGTKQASNDFAELAKQLGCSKIILGAHDWGGAVAWRMALWHPELLSHLFVVCTPYFPPSKDAFVPRDVLIKTRLPNFGYQLQLASGEVQKVVNTKDTIRQFLNAIYGGHGPNGEVGFSVEKGVIFENLALMQPSPLLKPEEMDYYVEEYARNGLEGTLNWYKTFEVNHQEELGLDNSKVTIPSLFIGAKRDVALLPSMSEGMGQYIPNLTKKEVDASHWALWQKPEEINAITKEWLAAQGLTAAKSSL